MLVTQHDFNKAAKIWSYCLIAKSYQKHEIGLLAIKYAENQLKKLGVINLNEIQNEIQAIKFVLRQKELKNGA